MEEKKAERAEGASKFEGQNCPVCEEPLVDPHTGIADAIGPSNCNHKAHRECFKEHIDNSMTAGNIPILCIFGEKCMWRKKKFLQPKKTTLDHNDLKQVLNKAEMEKYVQREFDVACG